MFRPRVRAASAKKRPVTRTRQPLCVEQLETRELLSQAVFPFPTASGEDVKLSLAGQDLVLTDTTSGATLLTQPLAGTDSLLAQGANGRTDTLPIDNSGGAIAIPITFQGGTGGTANLVLQAAGQLTNVRYAPSGAGAGLVSVDGATINYTGLTALADTTSAVKRTFDFSAFTGSAPQIRLADNGNATDGQLTVDSNGTGAFPSATVANPSGSLTVSGGPAGNTFFLQPLDSKLTAPVALQGGAGNDTLIVQDGVTAAASFKISNRFTAAGPAVTVTNFAVTYGQAVSFNGSIGVATSSAQLTLGASGGSSTLQATGTGLSATFQFQNNALSDVTFSGATATFAIGTYVTITANHFTIDTGATGSQTFASFGNLSAQVSVGKVSFGASVSDIAFEANGDISTGDNFAISLNHDTNTGTALAWPSWLPINVSSFAISWNDFVNAPTAFTLTLSASVKKLFNLPLNVTGSVTDVQIDIGKLEQGQFPITSIGSFSVGVSGDLFGGTINGTLILGLDRIDSSGTLIASADTQTTPATTVVYGGLEGGFSLGGTGGFEIQLGLSQLGPLDVLVSAQLPTGILLEPITELSINNFTGGVEFFKALPSVTPSGNFLAAFTAPMVIEGSATLYSTYVSQFAFNRNVGIELCTPDVAAGETGPKVLLDGTLNFADNQIALGAKLYADLSHLDKGAATVDFLSDIPTSPRLLTLQGVLTMGFVDASGNTVVPPKPTIVLPYTSATAPVANLGNAGNVVDAAALNNAAGTGKAGIYVNYTSSPGHNLNTAALLNGGPTFTFTGAGAAGIGQPLTPVLISSNPAVPQGASPTAAPGLAVQSMEVFYPFSGSFGAGQVNVAFTPGTFNDDGATGGNPNQSQPAQSFTVYQQPTGFQIHLGSPAPVGDNPPTPVVELVAPPQAGLSTPLVDLTGEATLAGVLDFSPPGSPSAWFHLDGSFFLQINSGGLSVFGTSTLSIGGATASPIFAFNSTSELIINSAGLAAFFTIGANAGSNTTGFSLSGQFTVALTTTGADQSIKLPQAILDALTADEKTSFGIGSDGKATIAGTAPPPPTGSGSPPAGPYFVMQGQGHLHIGSLDLSGQDYLAVTPTEIDLDASFALNVPLLGSFSGAADFTIGTSGLYGSAMLTASALSVPGASLSAGYFAEINTTGGPVSIPGYAIDTTNPATFGSIYPTTAAVDPGLVIGAGGHLTVGGMDLQGAFTFAVSTGGSSAALGTITAAGRANLGELGYVTVDGSLAFLANTPGHSDGGVVASIDVTLGSDLGGTGFAISGQALLDLNTTGNAQSGYQLSVDHSTGVVSRNAVNIPAHTALLQVGGSLSFAGLSLGAGSVNTGLTGLFSISASTDPNSGTVTLTLGIDADLNVFGHAVTVDDTIPLTFGGIELDDQVALNFAFDGTLLTGSGTAALLINTTNHQVTTSHGHTIGGETVELVVNNASFGLFDNALSASGSLTIGLQNGEFIASVPSTSPLTLTFFDWAPSTSGARCRATAPSVSAAASRSRSATRTSSAPPPTCRSRSTTTASRGALTPPDTLLASSSRTSRQAWRSATTTSPLPSRSPCRSSATSRRPGRSASSISPASPRTTPSSAAPAMTRSTPAPAATRSTPRADPMPSMPAAAGARSRPAVRPPRSTAAASAG